MSYLYHTFFFDPLYNLLIVLFKVLPWADAGIIVVLLTVLVRLVLYPLSKKAVVTQVKMTEITHKLEELKDKYKDKPELQAQKTLELYRENGINPFSGILMVIIQIPLIIALYQIFLHLPEINATYLYSFITPPEVIKTAFLGLIDVSGKSIFFAFLAGLSSYFQLHISARGQSAPKGNSFGDNLTRNMQSQLKYVFPVIMFFISYQVSGVIGLYFLTTNIFSTVQEIFVRKHSLAKSS